MDPAAPTPRRPRANRPLAAVLTAVVMAGVLAALVYGFAPDLPSRMADAALRAVAFTAPPPPKAPPPRPSSDAGASGAAGKKALARPVVAQARVPVRPTVAPTTAATGSADTSGARAAGAGSGASGPRQGPGSGAGGYGAGAGLPLRLIAGDIDSDRDYPKEGRKLRLGHSVRVQIDVSAAGLPTACRIDRAGPDPQADAITCQLAMRRFRFRPRTDVWGNPMAGVYAWEQRWFY